MGVRTVKLVSFSGIDGAGKSTQIQSLCQLLQSSGLQFARFTFWDDVVVFAKLREHASLKAFKGERGVGSPEKPIARRDKNVRSWYLTAVRLGFYLIDTFSLCSLIARNADSEADFIIFDRYIYDELANLPLQSWVVRAYLRLLLMFIPKPDLALLLDAEPESATLRKPEYPVEFVRHNREAYLKLSRFVGMTVVPPLPVEQAAEFVRTSVSQTCLQEDPVPMEVRLSYPLAPESAKGSSPGNMPTSC
jgi:thymidylate kinase